MHKITDRWLICLVLMISSCRMDAKSAMIDTVTTYSASMRKDIKAVVVKPGRGSGAAGFGSGKAKDERLPVLYLLHGYSGNYADWIKKVPAIQQYADQYGILIVCPDGNYGSWYFDSPEDSSWRYETYVSKELVSYIDQHYNTIRDRSGRAITGLSMGGHGALFLSFRHQDIYGAAGSMSGGVDIRPFPDSWDIAKRLGTESAHRERWEANSVINLTGLLKPGALSLIMDCGSEDFFYGVNEALHEKLLAEKIPHDFISRPGIHDWNYWGGAIEYQMVFFHHFFERGVIK